MIKPQTGDIWKFTSRVRTETYLIYEVAHTHRAGTYRVQSIYMEGGFPVTLPSWNSEDGWTRLA